MTTTPKPPVEQPSVDDVAEKILAYLFCEKYLNNKQGYKEQHDFILSQTTPLHSTNTNLREVCDEAKTLIDLVDKEMVQILHEQKLFTEKQTLHGECFQWKNKYEALTAANKVLKNGGSI